MNMYFLFSLGPLLETMWGRVRFLILYLVGALTGGVAVMLNMRAAVGASGALCGLLTSLGVWVYLNRRSLPPQITSTWLRNVFTNIVLIAFISTLPHVSWEGHLGGALGGALVSIPLNFHRFGAGWRRRFALIGIILVPVIALGLVYIKYRDVLQMVPALQKVVAQAENTLKDVAVPIINDWENPIDEARLTTAKTAFEGVKQDLQGTIALLDKVEHNQDKVLAENSRVRHVYLNLWLTFFDQISKTISEPQPWPNEAYTRLLRQRAIIDRAGAVLNHK
jgi:hypothetical protein